MHIIVNDRPRTGRKQSLLRPAAGRMAGWRRPKHVAAWAGGIVIAVLALGCILIAANSDGPATFLSPEDRLAPADAALVFSGDPNYERTLEAARLYRAGYARYLVFSGRGGPGDSAESMAQVALQQGVPSSALLMEREATSTYENVLFTRGLLARHGVHTLILVTSPYHQRRAYLVARHLLPRVTLINHPVHAWYWRPHGWWREPKLRAVVLDEDLKLAGYLLLGHI